MSKTKKSKSASPLADGEIIVSFEDMKLVIDQPDMAIDNLTSVTWNFVNIPEHWVPGILFTGDHGPYTGPFERVRLVSGAVIGLENTGRVGPFEYVAMLRDWRAPRRSVLFSAQAEIRQGPATVEVEVDLVSGVFRVEPQVCKIRHGDSVQWQFAGLDAGEMAEVRFLEMTPSDKNEPVPETPYFGPFESITFLEDGLVGSGSGSSSRGRYAYDVHVASLDSNHQGLSLRSAHSVDPIIDNEEDVPPPEDDPSC